MRMRQSYVLRLLSISLLVVAGSSCSGCGGGGTGAATPAQRYKQCLKIEDPARKANCLITLSADQERLKDRPGAKESRESAAAAAKDIRDAFNQVDTLLKLADAYVAAGEKGKAKTTYKTAEEFFEEIDKPGERARLLVRLAKLKLDADKRDGAEFATSDLKAAEALLENISLPTEKIEVLSLLSDGYRRLEDDEAVERVGKILLALPDSIDDWSDKVRALVAVAVAQRTAMDNAAAGLKNLDDARKIVEGVDFSSNNDTRLKTAYRRYEVAEAYINAGKNEPAREILDVADELAKKDPEGDDLGEQINELRARLR